MPAAFATIPIGIKHILLSRVRPICVNNTVSPRLTSLGSEAAWVVIIYLNPYRLFLKELLSDNNSETLIKPAFWLMFHRPYLCNFYKRESGKKRLICRAGFGNVELSSR